MTKQQEQEPVPEGLGDRGAKFWRELHAPAEDGSRLEFDQKEALLLLEACRVLDQIADLAAAVEIEGITVRGSMGQTVVHPAVPELRQQQMAFRSLMSSVRLPEDDGAAERFHHERAKAGAEARWNRPALRGVN